MVPEKPERGAELPKSAQFNGKVTDAEVDSASVSEGGELVPAGGVRRFNDAELNQITTFEDALALLEARGFTPEDVVDAAELGDGFLELKKDEKEVLIGRPFIILDATWSSGDFGEEGYYTLRVVTQDNRKYRLTDGSTGIARQIADHLHVNRLDKLPPMICKNGLSVSRYSRFDEELQKAVPTSTFYLDTKTGTV